MTVVVSTHMVWVRACQYYCGASRYACLYKLCSFCRFLSVSSKIHIEQMCSRAGVHSLVFCMGVRWAGHQIGRFDGCVELSLNGILGQPILDAIVENSIEIPAGIDEALRVSFAGSCTGFELVSFWDMVCDSLYAQNGMEPSPAGDVPVESTCGTYANRSGRRASVLFYTLCG